MTWRNVISLSRLSNIYQISQTVGILSMHYANKQTVFRIILISNVRMILVITS